MQWRNATPGPFVTFLGRGRLKFWLQVITFAKGLRYCNMLKAQSKTDINRGWVPIQRTANRKRPMANRMSRVRWRHVTLNGQGRPTFVRRLQTQYNKALFVPLYTALQPPCLNITEILKNDITYQKWVVWVWPWLVNIVNIFTNLVHSCNWNRR